LQGTSACVKESTKISFRGSNEKTEFLTDTQLKALLKAIEEDTNEYAGADHADRSLHRNEEIGNPSPAMGPYDFQHGSFGSSNQKGGRVKRFPLTTAAKEVFEKSYLEPMTVFSRIHGERKGFITPSEDKTKGRTPRGSGPLHGLRHHLLR